MVNDETNDTQWDDKGNNTHSFPNDGDIIKPNDITIPFTVIVPTTDQSGVDKSEKSREPKDATGDNVKLFQDEQIDDPSLHKYFDRAKKGDLKKVKIDSGSFT